MFGPFGEARALGLREKAKDAPERKVSREEFIRLAVAAGVDRPEFHANMVSAMGSSALIGNEKLRITKKDG